MFQMGPVDKAFVLKERRSDDLRGRTERQIQKSMNVAFSATSSTSSQELYSESVQEDSGEVIFIIHYFIQIYIYYLLYHFTIYKCFVVLICL